MEKSFDEVLELFNYEDDLRKEAVSSLQLLLFAEKIDNREASLLCFERLDGKVCQKITEQKAVLISELSQKQKQ